MVAERSSGDVGSLLREARERKGISLKEIANNTKISVAVLEALERNDITRLPGGIFSRAFVRSYAAQVGLDPEKTIQQFIGQFPNDSVVAGHPTSDQIEDNEALESDRRVAATFLWILAVSVPIAAGVLYLSTSGRTAPRPGDPPPHNAPAESRSDPKPAAEPPPSTAIAPPAALPAPTAPAAVKTVKPEPVAPPPATKPASASEDRLTVGLSVKRPVWVSATVDGQKAIERLLQTGEHQTIEVRREMVITAGDASAISMTLNGAEARALGKAGEVITARVNLGNFKDYLQNR